MKRRLACIDFNGNKLRKIILAPKKTIFYILNKSHKQSKRSNKNTKRDYFTDGQILNEKDMCLFYRKIYGIRLEIHNFVIPRIIQQGGTVLEIACGIGLNYDRLRYHPQISRYTGIDTSSNAVKYAKDLYGAHFIRCDGQKTSFSDNEFDISFALSVADHLDNYKILLNEMVRVTKKTIIMALCRELIDEDNIKQYKIESPERLEYIIDSYKKDKEGNYIYYFNQYSKENLANYVRENFRDYEYKIEKLPSYDPENFTNADVLILTKKTFSEKH
jgi:ubiquinone/menaquinone biosynthesis C-methylase UbiE